MFRDPSITVFQIESVEKAGELAASRAPKENGKAGLYHSDTDRSGNSLGIRGFLEETDQGKPALMTKFSYLYNLGVPSEDSSESHIVADFLSQLPKGSKFAAKVGKKARSTFGQSAPRNVRRILTRLSKESSAGQISESERTQVENAWSSFAAEFHQTLIDDWTTLIPRTRHSRTDCRFEPCLPQDLTMVSVGES